MAVQGLLYAVWSRAGHWNRARLSHAVLCDSAMPGRRCPCYRRRGSVYAGRESTGSEALRKAPSKLIERRSGPVSGGRRLPVLNCRLWAAATKYFCELQVG